VLKLFLLRYRTQEIVKKIAYRFINKGYKVGIITKEENKNKYNGNFNVKILGPKENLKICAANLFNILREFDKDKTDIIIAEGIREKGIGIAIMDRLRKASGFREYK